MTADTRTEARRQLDYIAAELARGDRTSTDRDMLVARRVRILETNPKERT